MRRRCEKAKRTGERRGPRTGRKHGVFFFSSRRRHTRYIGDWSSDVCSSDLKRWGPYLSERQWGTVREDYSRDGSAWTYFPHDHARSRAYRWGEDGLAGISDRHQFVCFSLALWNEIGRASCRERVATWEVAVA